MARTFTQLTYEQRVQIKQMLDQGISKRRIAETIGVHHSTVYREIERGTVNETYDPEYAEKKYQEKLAEKGKTAILDDNPQLAKEIADMILNEKLSPEKVVERLKQRKQYAKIPLSKETIYYNLDNGRIPGVTRESLRTSTSKIFSGGQICIPKWVMEEMDLKDGDILRLEVTENNEIIYKKEENSD